MTSIITGDIINSRKVRSSKKWIEPLKKLLTQFGKSPRTWEIYRGDSFQLEVKNPADAFLAALKIKACIRSIKGLDVRMSIGIGEKSYSAARITESNGDAFIYSGEQFEELKKIKERLAIRSPWPEIDKEINLLTSLAAMVMDKWTPLSAEMVILSLKYHKLSQAQLGARIKRGQSTISERQKRAHYREIMEAEAWYRNRISQKLNAV